ncbi:FAD-dependent oxidoreductase, partial [Thermodesulfobacteriota bacterium]
AQMGKAVKIVEAIPRIMTDAFGINRRHLMTLLDDASVHILTNTAVSEITEDGILTTDQNGDNVFIAADTVVLATGLKSKGTLFMALTVPEVYVIGDYLEQRTVREAIWEGFHAARQV